MNENLPVDSSKQEDQSRQTMGRNPAGTVSGLSDPVGFGFLFLFILELVECSRIRKDRPCWELFPVMIFTFERRTVRVFFKHGHPSE